MATSFGGQQIKTPGAFSVVDTTGMTPITLGAFNVLAFIGVPSANITAGLDTTQVLYYNSPKLAGQDLVDGDVLDNMRVAWAHGADLIAVSFVKRPTTGEPTDADWQTAIDRLETEFVDALIPVTTQQAIHLKVMAHITNMSTVKNRKERRGFYGHAKGLAVSALVELKTSYADGRAVLASPAVQDFDASGAKVTKDSVLLASAYAGTWASKNPQDPITYDYVKFAGLEKHYNGVEIEQLLDAGIAVTQFVKGKGYRIVQGITTSPSQDLTERELSVATLKDVMSRNLREILEEKHVGKAGVAGIEVTIYNDVITILDGFVKNGWITEYVQDSVQVEKNATAFTVDWEGKPTLPINNFFITSHFTL